MLPKVITIQKGQSLKVDWREALKQEVGYVGPVTPIEWGTVRREPDDC
jgi:hypothetical protein